MFRDLNGYLPRREPLPQRPKFEPLTPRQESVLMWVLGFNLLMALLGPFCGSSVVEAIVSVIRAL
jgi:hypothetical protein